MMTEEGKTVIPHCPHNMCPTRGRFRLQGMHYRLSLGETPPLQKSVHSLCVRVLLCFWHTIILFPFGSRQNEEIWREPNRVWPFFSTEGAMHCTFFFVFSTARSVCPQFLGKSASRRDRAASPRGPLISRKQRRGGGQSLVKLKPHPSHRYLQTGAPVYFVSAGSASWRRPTNVSPRGRVLRSLLMTW
jgi:hypothetical protein